MLGLQERDRVVVRDDQAVETELVPQQRGQQFAVARHRNPVDVGVGRHHRPRPAPDRHLERHQEHVGELAAADGHRRQVAGRPGGRIAGEVLQRGLDAGRLQPAHVRGADRTDQVGVLADGLLHPSPARVPGHVEDRRQALVNADLPHAGADGRGHLADQPGIEGRAPGQRRREDGGRPGGESGQALLVRDGRDAEPARRDDLRLQLAQRQDGVPRRHRPGAEHPGELAQAVPDELGQRRFLGAELALHRGHVAVPRLVAQPEAGQLRGLLLQRHPAKQVRDPLRSRPGRIPPGLRVLVKHRAAHRAGPTVPVDSGVNSTASPSPSSSK